MDEDMEDGEVSSLDVSDPQVIPESEKELEDLVTKRALNTEDRYRILEARDKILRIRNPKVKVRVEFAVRLSGSCPDMCPEKERYMRVVQHRLASFECLPGDDYEVDHQTAVKEYSRSSADQEEPLPHDLRPVSTLHLTFNYLLHHIISKCENTENQNLNLNDWYCFVWDRTRAIRKDMTQQQLCDLEAVALMEKCTRFHIYCSSRLCELDRHAFDPKLNDENLMKCLQSLEHMYTDLTLKGIECPNEPEFRAYELLMNLNEGDILWEIQQRPGRILEAPEVKIALKIQLAVYSNNFVSFFRLLNQVPYLTACIIHRYFFQIRTSAIRSLVKAHTTPKNVGVPMSMATAKRFLGYDDQSHSSFLEFCDLHGILCDTRGGTILLNKRDLIYPDAPIINREYQLIDSKLKVSVSEAINGAPLDPFPNYNPYSSFDENGYLKKDLLAEVMTTKKLARPPKSTTPNPISTTSIPQQGLATSRNRGETKSPVPVSLSSVITSVPSIVRIRPHTQPLVQQPHRLESSDKAVKAKTGAARLFSNSVASIFGGSGGKRNPTRPVPLNTKKSIKERLQPNPNPASDTGCKLYGDEFKAITTSISKSSAGIFGSKSKVNDPDDETEGQLESKEQKPPALNMSVFGPSTLKVSSSSGGFGPSTSTASDSSKTSAYGSLGSGFSAAESVFPPSSVFGIKKESDVPDAKISALKTSPGGFSFRVPAFGMKQEQAPMETPAVAAPESVSVFGLPKTGSSSTSSIFSSPQFKTSSTSIFGQTDKGFGQTTPGSIGSIFSVPTFGVPLPKPVIIIGPDKPKVAADVVRETETKIINEVVAQELRQLTTEALKAAIIEKEAEIQKEKLRALQQVIAAEALKRIENQVIQEMIAEISKSEIERFQLYELLAIEIGSQLFYDVVKEVSTEIAEEAHNEAIKEFEQRVASMRVVLRRLKLRSWFQQWRIQAAEQKAEREARREKQLQNLENFPPIVSFPLSPATILGTWFGLKSPMVMVNTKKFSLEPSPMEFIERSVKLRKSFEQKLDQLAPCVLNYLTADLTIMLEKEEGFRGSALHSEFLPPVVFNVVLWSEFGPFDRLANWLWTSLSQDCMYLQSDLLAHTIRLRYGDYVITFQKCSDPVPEISSETAAIIVFCRTEQTNLKIIPTLLKQPTTILLFNTSKMSEAQIRRSVKQNGLLHDLCILHAEESLIVDDVPAIVRGLQWLSMSVPRGPPLNPLVSFPPLNHAVSTLFETYFQLSMKRVNCAAMLFQEHNNLVFNLKKIISTPENVDKLSQWPGMATSAWAEKCDIELPRPVWEFPDKLQYILWIEPPITLLYHFHESVALAEAEYRDLLSEYGRNMYVPGTPSIAFMTGINEVLSKPWKGIQNVPWKKLLLTCQQYKIACLETLIPTAFDPVSVDLTEFKNTGSILEDTFCHNCSVLVSRKRSLADDQRALEACPPKAPRSSSANNLLQEINELMKQVRNEKSLC